MLGVRLIHESLWYIFFRTISFKHNTIHSLWTRLYLLKLSCNTLVSIVAVGNVTFLRMEESRNISYCNIVRTLVLSNSYCAIMNKIVLYPWLCSIKWRVQFYKKLQNFCRVMSKFLLCKSRQCEDYSEQSKPYFELLPGKDVYFN